MTTLLKHHHLTSEIALFESSTGFWIGIYFAGLTHQNGEPPYLLHTECDSLFEGLDVLSKMSGNEC